VACPLEIAVAESGFRHVLQDSRVHLLNIGMRFKEEIDANLKLVTGAPIFTAEDRGLLAEFSTKLYDSDAIRKLKVE